jgi:hypothetical protein
MLADAAGVFAEIVATVPAGATEIAADVSSPILAEALSAPCASPLVMPRLIPPTLRSRAVAGPLARKSRIATPAAPRANR